MKSKIIMLIFVMSMTTIIAENPLSLNFEEGKNNFTVEEYFPPIYASELIKEYPQIESISILEYGSTYGYINTLGGVGINLLIEAGKNYEIHVNQSTTVNLKK